MKMKWLCLFKHDYQPLPKEPGVFYIGDFGGLGSGRWNGPEKCRRCGAEHPGLRIPRMPPAVQERFERGERVRSRKHIREVLQKAKAAR